MAFVHTYPDGDRDFSFYRNPGADMMLRKEEVSLDKICDPKSFILERYPLLMRESGQLHNMQFSVRKKLER